MRYEPYTSCQNAVVCCLAAVVFGDEVAVTEQHSTAGGCAINIRNAIFAHTQHAPGVTIVNHICITEVALRSRQHHDSSTTVHSSMQARESIKSQEPHARHTNMHQYVSGIRFRPFTAQSVRYARHISQPRPAEPPKACIPTRPDPNPRYLSIAQNHICHM